LATFPLQAACPGGVSNHFTVSGEVTKRAVFDLNDLEQFPPTQQNVTYFAAGSVVTEVFTGVLLWDLLNNLPVNGMVTNPTIKNDILHKVVIVTGTDSLPLGRRVEAIAEQVEKHPGHLLRRQLRRGEAAVELQREAS
jgi:hypothetical protein